MIALASFATLALSVPAAMAQPTIDGNLTDFINYGATLTSTGTGFGVAITDKPGVGGAPTVETIYNDVKFIPCPQPQPALGSHWVNGTEIFYHYLAYVPGSTTLYLGIRTEGIVGDSDGDNDPNLAGAPGANCNPADNIEDFVGISGNEIYAWSFDLNCDRITDASIRIQDNQVIGSGLFAGVTGTLAFEQNGGTGATGHDLEVQVNLTSPLPAAFKYVRAEANAFDGLSEDRSDGVVLVGKPKITVEKSAVPASICVGQNTRFTILVTNSGQTPLSVVVTDVLPAAITYAGGLSSTCGVGAPQQAGSTLTFPAFDLAVGASCSISFDATAAPQCFGTVTNNVEAVGTFNSACLDPAGLSDLASASATVTCLPQPCVEVTASGPTSACAGDRFTISGTARNCTPDAETIVVTIDGVQVFNASVNGNTTINWSGSVSMPAACTPGQKTNFAIVATGTNTCGTDTENATVGVDCASPPCVTLQAIRTPESACPGAPVTISGTVGNCSNAEETIVITVNGAQFFSQLVAAGGSVQFSTQVTMPACTAGQSVPFAVVATATGGCPPADVKTVNLSVLCTNPVIDVVKSVSPAGAVDQGTTLTYTITVTNPSKTVALDNVVVTDPLCSEVTFQGNAVPAPNSGPAVGANGTLVWNLGVIAPGGSVTITFDVLVNTLPSPACEASNRSCTNNVVATGDCADARARAEYSVTTPINPCIASGLCRLTGGGCLNEEGGQRGHKQSTFGGNSSPFHEGGGPTGNSWTHVYRDGRTILFNWHSPDAHVIACSVVSPGPCSPAAENTRADFVGTGTYSIGAGGRTVEGNMVAYIIDHREGACNRGTRDEYSIIIREGSVIGEGAIVFQTSGEIDCGNLQIHETPARLFGSGIALPGNEAGTTGVALLNRAYPNPFSGSTTFAYKVADAGAQVEVGVYNVAGRLVKSLAAGSQPAGTYTVKWNGSDDSGVQMAPGVYFLKSKIGADQVVSRLIYVAK